MSCRRQAVARRSTSGPGTSTALACSRSHSSSQPPNDPAPFAQALDGYSGTNVSGSTASWAPASAASPSRATALSTDACASRISGVAWIAATRTVWGSLTGARLLRRPYHRARMVLGRGLLVALCGLALCCAVPAGAGAAVAKSTARVPVSSPDEYGQPVALETDVYLPGGAAPAGGWPLIEVFHGGASNKDNPFDAGHARFYAEHGYAALIYSQRGQGGSDGQVAVAGPKEMRDLFDVTAWALARFPIDRARIGLTGYSQGGLHTNLGQVWSGDAALNPTGIRFGAVEPGNTPDFVFDALVDHGVVKLSYGLGLLGTYYKDSGGPQRVAPKVTGWVATAAADQPALYGGDHCDLTGHDTLGSTMKADLAARSGGG